MMIPSIPGRFHRVRRLTTGWSLLPLGLLLGGGPALADPSVVARQATITLRAIAYDNNLSRRAGGSLSVVVLYKEGNASSVEMSQQWVDALARLGDFKVQGMPVRFVRLAYTGEASLRSAIAAQGLDVLFICTGLEAELETMKSISRSAKLLTVAGASGFVERGLSLGVFLVGDKNSITVNLQANSEEGVSFSSDLLRLARVVR